MAKADPKIAPVQEPAKNPETPKVAEVQRPYQLQPKRFSLENSGQTRNEWRAVLESGRPYESIFKSEFWAHVSKSLKIGDHIEILNDEMTFASKVIVVDARASGARVQEIQGGKSDLAPVTDANAVEGYSIEYKGPHLKFCVVRKSDGARLREGFVNVVEAQTWAINDRRQSAA
jgi:hypothetical protein